MRISAGQFKGRKVASRRLFARRSHDDELRPTSAKVREAVFDILRGLTEGSVFLDLYAGTGAVGFEALSRGARQVWFVEKHPGRAEAIRRYADDLGAGGAAAVCRETAARFLERAFLSGWTFDIIFADPSYASDECERILHLLDRCLCLSGQGCVIVEHGARTALPGETETLMIARQYRYGDTMLTLYRWKR